MTIYKEKLKALADAAGGVSWSWWTSNSTLRLTTEQNGRHGADGDAVSAHDSNVVCPRAYREFIEAVGPVTILDLLAEIGRLESDNSSMRGSTKRMGEDASRAQKQERKRQREIAQLKVESEALRYDCQVANSVVLAERMDAERYRWLRDRCGIVEYKAIAGSIGPGMLPSGEKLEMAIDAVMSKGEQP